MSILPKQAQDDFPKVSAFKSLSVDMSIINRLIFTSKLTERASTPKQNSLSQVFSSSLDIAKLLAMAKGCAGSQSSLKKQKNSGLLWEGRRTAVLVSFFLPFPFPVFFPSSPLLHLEATFFPFLSFSQGMQSDLVCKNANTVHFLKYKQLQKSVESQL